MTTSAVQEAEARLLLAAVSALVQSPESAKQIYAPLLAAANSPEATLITQASLLQILLVHASPLSVSVQTVSDLAFSICSRVSEVDFPDIIDSLETSASSLVADYSLELPHSDNEVLTTAHALILDLNEKASLLGFLLSTLTTPQAILLAFVQAKSLQLARFHPSIDFHELYEPLRGYGDFEAWYNGFVLPFEYVRSNFAVSVKGYLSESSHWGQFSVLQKSAPPNSPSFLAHVTLPLAVYHNCDLGPFLDWLHREKSAAETLDDFQYWDKTLRAIVSFKTYTGEPLSRECYTPIIKHYLTVCLYFGMCKDLALTALVVSEIQLQIKSTLGFLSPAPVNQISLPDLEVSGGVSSFDEFLNNDLVRSFLSKDTSATAATLLSVFSTCCALYPLNNLTLKKYCELKNLPSSDPVFRKQLMLLLTRIEPDNISQMHESVSIFTSLFLDAGGHTNEAVDETVFDRFLQVNSFDNALKYLDTVATERPVNVNLEHVLLHFWELLHAASNLDDRIGKVKLATSCLEILSAPSVKALITPSISARSVRIKHLLKAFHDLKNFKLTLIRNQPVTPKQILEKLAQFDEEDKHAPISLVSIVLEQNPKLYLAFEKLHRIVNELAIYLELNTSQVSFARVQLACVESALVDGNFEFAYKQSKNLISYVVAGNKLDQIADVWLMFYQVGKYILPEWFNDPDEKTRAHRLDVLKKQREILALAIKYTKVSDVKSDNTHLLVGQFSHLNQEIYRWYQDAEDHALLTASLTPVDETKPARQTLSYANAQNDFSVSKQASEKISNLLVSGIGWAIGAHQQP